MRSDFYLNELVVPPLKPCRADYVPRELTGRPWQFFFDEGAMGLELTSAMSGVEENLAHGAPASLFVFALPALLLGVVRAPMRAEIALYNPTAEPVPVKVWIGDREALSSELARLQREAHNAKRT